MGIELSIKKNLKHAVVLDPKMSKSSVVNSFNKHPVNLYSTYMVLSTCKIYTGGTELVRTYRKLEVKFVKSNLKFQEIISANFLLLFSFL